VKINKKWNSDFFNKLINKVKFLANCAKRKSKKGKRLNKCTTSITFCNINIIWNDKKKTKTQQLQKVLLHSQPAALTDDQIITHLRNALKKEVIDWLDSLPALGVSQTEWAPISTRFEIDYKAKARPTSEQEW
jgi:hypothetical protein